MSEVESLSSILSDAPQVAKPEVTVEPVIEPKAEVKTEPKAETTDKSRDEQGRFAKTEPAKPEMPRRDVAAIIDERKKRQAAEDQLKVLQGQKPKTDVWEDPEKAISERVSEATQPLQAKFFRMSMRTAQKEHADFQDVAEHFIKASESDPELTRAMREADDPGEYVYNIGLQLKELSDVGGDFAKYREKITGEKDQQIADKDKTIVALTAELESLKKGKDELSSVPRSLNKQQSGSSPTISDTDPDDIKSIVRFGNKR